MVALHERSIVELEVVVRHRPKASVTFPATVVDRLERDVRSRADAFNRMLVVARGVDIVE